MTQEKIRDEGNANEESALGASSAAPIPEAELQRWEDETGEHRDNYPLDPDEFWATQRAFILFRKDEPGDHEGTPVAVYTFDQREACKADLGHRQSVNPDSFYYVLDKPLNPKAAS